MVFTVDQLFIIQDYVKKTAHVCFYCTIYEKMQRVCANNKVLIEKYPGNLEWATLLPTPFAVMSFIMLRTTEKEVRLQPLVK